jgi:hypothetical protein
MYKRKQAFFYFLEKGSYNNLYAAKKYGYAMRFGAAMAVIMKNSVFYQSTRRHIAGDSILQERNINLE